jgi:hypothetical protein
LSIAFDNGVSVSRGWFAGSSIEFVLQCGHKIEKTGERKKKGLHRLGEWIRQ